MSNLNNIRAICGMPPLPEPSGSVVGCEYQHISTKRMALVLEVLHDGCDWRYILMREANGHRFIQTRECLAKNWIPKENTAPLESAEIERRNAIYWRDQCADENLKRGEAECALGQAEVKLDSWIKAAGDAARERNLEREKVFWLECAMDAIYRLNIPAANTIARRALAEVRTHPINAQNGEVSHAGPDGVNPKPKRDPGVALD